MDNFNYIIQWNLNGIKSRIGVGELQRLITNYNPICLCLQHIGEQDTNIKNYKLVSQSIKNTTELGTAIYVRNDITVDHIAVQTSEFQYSATVLQLSATNKFTLCNIYNQPIFNYNFENLKNILNNLPRPYLLLGDFNVHSPLWEEDCITADVPGKKVELILCYKVFCNRKHRDTCEFGISLFFLI